MSCFFDSRCRCFSVRIWPPIYANNWQDTHFSSGLSSGKLASCDCCTLCPQNVHLFIFLNNSVKNWLILIIFGMLNTEKIWHEHLTDLLTLPVTCSHFSLGNPKKSFFNIIIHMQFPVTDDLRKSFTVIFVNIRNSPPNSVAEADTVSLNLTITAKAIITFLDDVRRQS